MILSLSKYVHPKFFLYLFEDNTGRNVTKSNFFHKTFYEKMMKTFNSLLTTWKNCMSLKNLYYGVILYMDPSFSDLCQREWLDFLQIWTDFIDPIV